MRICFIGNPQIIHLQRWMTYFIDKGHEVHVITPQPAEVEGAYIHEISLSAFYDVPTYLFYRIRIIGYIFNMVRRYRLIKQTKKIIEKINPDVLNAHYLTYYGVFASQLDFHPFLITVWGSDILIDLEKYGHERASLMKKALEKADMIHSVSNQMTEQIKNMKIEAEKIITLPEGADLTEFNLNEIEEYPTEIEELKGNNIVISSRAFEPVYNIELLIKAIPKVIEKRDDIRFLIIGNGSGKQKLIELSEKLDVCNYIKFMGEISHSKIALFYKVSDVYVSTSLSDGSSVSLHEAMACGVFPVITDIEGNRHWVENGKNGFLVPTDNPYILATSIIKAFEKSDLRESAKTINWNIVKEKGNSIVTKNEIERIFFNLVKK